MWPPKGTNGCEITSFQPLCVKIATKPTKERTDRYVNKKNPHKTCFFTHAQIRNGRIDSNQILHINSLAGRSYIFDMTSMGFGGVGCENWPLPLTLALASNTAYWATAHTLWST